MRVFARTPSFICARCLRARRQLVESGNGVRNNSSESKPPSDGELTKARPVSRLEKEREDGAMSRRLSEMSEENIETGGRSAARAIEDSGFNDDLKNRLLERIANANFRSDNAAAFAEANLPSGASKNTRDIAAARPWTGTESTQDAALRMLTDAHKPVRVAPTSSSVRSVRGPPSRIDTGRPKNKVGAGARIASAREKASTYETSKDASKSEQEREEFRKVMQQRFQAGARAVPGSVQGLAALANERIEDAIARGQFKNLPRGKKLERDYTANSPFIDTTTYFMNKMIQKQEIVPPWIEKQQELVSTASRFRARLRADWKRHVSRVISSRGGGMERQVLLAEAYAIAEAVDNPPRKKEEQINAVTDTGIVSQITIASEVKVAPATETDGEDNDTKLETEISIIEQSFNEDGSLKSDPEEAVTITAEEADETSIAVATEPAKPLPLVNPFRDPQWIETERAYLTAAVDQLNSMARSYNLMAPAIARKPYYCLERELKKCYADVAPQVAAAVRERALAPKAKPLEIVTRRPGSSLERFSTKQAGHVHDDTKPQYGFKEFWKDLFGGSKI